MPGWRSNSRALKVSNSLRVISSLVDSNSVRSATSLEMYSFMPFCMTIASVSAAFSNSILLTRLSHRATAAAPTAENSKPTPTATTAGR